jgi:hypothetical protein
VAYVALKSSLPAEAWNRLRVRTTKNHYKSYKN